MKINQLKSTLISSKKNKRRGRGSGSGLGKTAKVQRKSFHKADMITSWADISKAKRFLNWEPEISVEEGIQKTVEWHKANRSWLNEIQL